MHQLVEELLKAGVDINRTSRDGFTPLSIATFWGCNDIVKVLLKNGSGTPSPPPIAYSRLASYRLSPLLVPRHEVRYNAGRM